MPQWKDLIYGITLDKYVTLGSNKYNYSKNLELLDIIKKYKKVMLTDSFDSQLDFIPNGVEELILGHRFDQPLLNLTSSIKKIVFEADGYYPLIGYSCFNMNINLDFGLSF
jgi:hypothetical protein